MGAPPHGMCSALSLSRSLSIYSFILPIYLSILSFSLSTHLCTFCVHLSPAKKSIIRHYRVYLRSLFSSAMCTGGIAFGLDRLVMLLAGAKSIRDVIAFPKTTTAHCALTKAPSPVDPQQLRELSLSTL